MLSDLVVRALRTVPFRGKVRLLNLFVPRAGRRQAVAFGSRFDLDLSDWIQRMVYFGSYEQEDVGLLKRYLRPGMTVVDAGANVGYFTALFAAAVGAGGRVIAVEPSPRGFAALTRLVGGNGLTQVKTVNAGLGAKSGSTELFLPPAAVGNDTPTMAPTPGWEKQVVPVVRLDDLLREEAVGQVDLLKLDVEGYEAEVLAGAAEALRAGRVRAVLCEFNDYYLRQLGTSPGQLWDRLAGYGFRPHPRDHRPEFVPGCIDNVFLRQSE